MSCQDGLSQHSLGTDASVALNWWSTQHNKEKQESKKWGLQALWWCERRYTSGLCVCSTIASCSLKRSHQGGRCQTPGLEESIGWVSLMAGLAQQPQITMVWHLVVLVILTIPGREEFVCTAPGGDLCSKMGHLATRDGSAFVCGNDWWSVALFRTHSSSNCTNPPAYW